MLLYHWKLKELKQKSGFKNAWESFNIYLNARTVFRHCWTLHHTWIRSLNLSFLCNQQDKAKNSPLDLYHKEAEHLSTSLCKTCSEVPQCNPRSRHWHFSIFWSFSILASQQGIWFKAKFFLPFSLSLSPSLAGLVKWVKDKGACLSYPRASGEDLGMVLSKLSLSLVPCFGHNGLFFSFSIWEDQ